MAQRLDALSRAQEHLFYNGIGLVELFLFTLSPMSASTAAATALQEDVRTRTPDLISGLHNSSLTSNAMLHETERLARQHYTIAAGQLAQKKFGRHASAANMNPAQIRDFRISDVCGQMRAAARGLWGLIYSLLSGEQDCTPDIESQLSKEHGNEWDMVLDALSRDEDLEERESRIDPRVLCAIKTTVILSIVTQSRNRHCNDLQSVTGFFLHACNAPDKVIRVLSRMGLSISATLINRAVRSLRRKVEDDITALASTRLHAIGYDNLDFKNPTKVIDDPSDDRLFHIASADMIQLAHGVTLSDLECCDVVWDRQDVRLNPHASNPVNFDPLAVLERMCTLHPQTPHPSGLSRNGRFVAWLFTNTLISHGPPIFQEFKRRLKAPESVEVIPVVPLEHVVLPAMDFNLSTHSGNIQLLDFIRENICDIHDDEDLANLMQIVHGDMGTFEHVLGAQKQRSPEHTQCDRLQYVAFVIGLFHLKMAAADALWRMFVPSRGQNADHEETSFARYVTLLYPDNTGKLFSRPEFRQQHEALRDVGTVLRLDAWTSEIILRFGGRFRTLAEYAASEPRWEDIWDMAITLAKNYCAGESAELDDDIFVIRRWPDYALKRDEQRENTKLIHQYLALYQHLSYAMDWGDIGMLETLLPAWVHLFRATGKHKYANRILLFMHNLYFVYPEGLRRAIRYNILVNPTGKPGHFRAVDWIIELLNLYIKTVYGGEGSSYTKDRVLLESPLVLLFRDSHASFEHNFRLSGLTLKHKRKDMREIFARLMKHMAEHRPNMTIAGRKSKKLVPDMVARGAELLMAEAAKYASASFDEILKMVGDADEDTQITADDISIDFANDL